MPEDIDAFINNHILAEQYTLDRRFNFAFQELDENKIQKYRLRYILAKLTQYVNESAWGEQASQGLDTYLNGAVDVEHILPRQSTEGILASFDQPDRYDEFKVKLGNLTLLEKTINSSLSNDGFSTKLSSYCQSSLLLTKSIAIKPEVGQNTALNRAVKDLKQFTAWNSETIQERQLMLTQLARRVWGMREVS